MVKKLRQSGATQTQGSGFSASLDSWHHHYADDATDDYLLKKEFFGAEKPDTHTKYLNEKAL